MTKAKRPCVAIEEFSIAIELATTKSSIAQDRAGHAKASASDSEHYWIPTSATGAWRARRQRSRCAHDLTEAHFFGIEVSLSLQTFPIAKKKKK